MHHAIVLAQTTPPKEGEQKELKEGMWKSVVLVTIAMLAIIVGAVVLHKVRKWMKDEEMI